MLFSVRIYEPFRGLSRWRLTAAHDTVCSPLLTIPAGSTATGSASCRPPSAAGHFRFFGRSFEPATVMLRPI
jgi:hypothetical protein